MAYGIQTFSEINGNTLFDSTKPYKGVSTVASGTVAVVNVYNPADSAAGVIFNEEDIVLFKPTGTIPSGTMFLVTGKTIEYSTFPTVTYKVFFRVDSIYGTPPTTMDYIVIRPMNNAFSSESYGLVTQDYVGGYTIRTFDSRIFTSRDQVQVDNMYTYRFQHTSSFGTINNGEYYNTSSLQMLSATGILLRVGIVYSNTGSSWNGQGPFPYTFSGTGHFHYGQASSYSNYERFESDYYLRAKNILN